MLVNRQSPSRRRKSGGTRRTGRRNEWLFFGAPALVALLLYLPTLRYGFVWDDRMLVLDDPFLDRTNPIQLLTEGFWNNPEAERGGDYMSYYRPLTNISLYVDRKVWGLNPTGYHLTNVIINAAAAFLMSLLLWEMFGSVWLTGLGGLLVGIHPAMNCVAAFVSNRTYLLALLFLLAGNYALLRGRHSRALIWPVLFGCSLLLGALAIEAALAFAAVAATWFLLNRTGYRRPGVWIAATVLPAAVYALLRLGIARVPLLSPGSVTHWTATEPLRVINAFGQQLQLLLYPFNQKVIYTPTGPFTGFSVYSVLGLLFLALPVYALIHLGRSTNRFRNARGAESNIKTGNPAYLRAEAGRLGWYGYLWMVLFLLPFAHLVFLGPSGRMLYLAAPGALILLAALYQATDHKRRTTRFIFSAVLLCAAAFAAQTVRRNPIWQSELTLTRAMVLEAPASATGHASYGLILSSAGRQTEAIEQLRIAVELDPNFAEPRIGLAYALIDQGDMAGAIRELREAVRIRPGLSKARNDLAVALTRNGQIDAAIAEYQEALRLDPNSDLTLNNLGYAYMAAGNFEQAIATLKTALRLRPEFTGARRNLADAYRKAGMPDSAALVESGK